MGQVSKTSQHESNLLLLPIVPSNTNLQRSHLNKDFQERLGSSVFTGVKVGQIGRHGTGPFYDHRTEARILSFHSGCKWVRSGDSEQGTACPTSKQNQVWVSTIQTWIRPIRLTTCRVQMGPKIYGVGSNFLIDSYRASLGSFTSNWSVARPIAQPTGDLGLG